MTKKSRKVVIIVQARMTSTRLPGKILRPVLGKPLLEYQIERLQQIPSKPDIWLATTTNQSDDVTVELAKKLKIPFFRGSESDVLSRYYYCAKEANADAVLRVTADCPLIDPDVVEKIIQTYLEGEADYVSNTIERSYPRGLDAEIFSFASLENAFQHAESSSDREHVTPYIRKFFKTKNVLASKQLSDHRWTVDTLEDFELIRLLLESLHPKNSQFRLDDALQMLSVHSEWSKINADVEQKKE